MRLTPILSFAAAIFLAGCKPAEEIRDFSSDGCSLFPDRSLISQVDWCDCCFQHDIAYWQGGTAEERLLADIALRDCVLSKTNNPHLAETMYKGVRFGGSPYFYNWYRWGYGWDYPRSYQPLTPAELLQVQTKLTSYLTQNPSGPCP